MVKMVKMVKEEREDVPYSGMMGYGEENQSGITGSPNFSPLEIPPTGGVNSAEAEFAAGALDSDTGGQLRLATDAVPRKPLGPWADIVDLQVADWRPSMHPTAGSATELPQLSTRELIRSIDGWAWPSANSPCSRRALPRATADFVAATLRGFDQQTLFDCLAALTGEASVDAVLGQYPGSESLSSYTVSSRYELMLASFTTPEFVTAWWRYLDMRWRVFGEWPDAVTQIITLWELRDVPNQTQCIWQSISGSLKGVHCLRETRHLFPQRVPLMLHSSRAQRTQHHDGITVRDTVHAWSSWPLMQPRQSKKDKPQ